MAASSSRADFIAANYSSMSTGDSYHHSDVAEKESASSTIFPLHLRTQITFKPAAADLVDVFYDSLNGEIFVVQRNGNYKLISFIDLCGVVVDLDIPISRDQPILSIKHSNLHNILAIQSSSSSIQLRNLENSTPGQPYELRLAPSASIQTSSANAGGGGSGATSRIIGFVWASPKHIIVIRNFSVELYEITSEKRSSKCIKSFGPMLINWYTFHAASNMLVISTTPLGNTLETYQFKGSALVKLCRFHVDYSQDQSTWSNVGPCAKRVTFQNTAASSNTGTSASRSSQRSEMLYDRDVALVLIYGKMRLLVLRSDASKTACRNHIAVYTFIRSAVPKVTHTLSLALTGRFAFNVTDDLIIVHHQSSQTSLIYDIHYDPATSKQDGIFCIQPILPPVSIKPTFINGKSIELYPCHWVIFQPNVIIDANAGTLWHLDVDLKSTSAMMHKKCDSLSTVQFLVQRRNSKLVICNHVKQILLDAASSETDSEASCLGHLCAIFNKLNSILTLFEEHEKMNSKSWTKLAVIDQAAMITYVFSSSNISDDLLLFVMIEYIRSLLLHSIPVIHSIYELLINLLVKMEKFYLLNQLSMYKVLSDSKPLACLLLSLSSKYPSAQQLALDMLKRLGSCTDEIIEILLAQGQVMRALNVIEDSGHIGSVSARQFLEVALASGPQSFVAVYDFFQLRNEHLRGSANFVSGERCEPFVQHYKQLMSQRE